MTDQTDDAEDSIANDARRNEEKGRRIRERAYAIWVAEGQPDGRALEHWIRAKWELESIDPVAESKRIEADFSSLRERD